MNSWGFFYIFKYKFANQFNPTKMTNMYATNWDETSSKDKTHEKETSVTTDL